MKIAYLIAAHSDVKHLKRLIDSLDLNADFYIHIDKKVDITPFLDAIKKENVFFSDKRVNVYWAAFSQVEYQRILLQNVMDGGIHYDRVCFISGLDYPIRSNREIHKLFSDFPQVEFIKGMNLSELPASAPVNKKIVLYHFFRDLNLNIPRLKYFICALSYKIMFYLPVRKRLRIKDHAKTLDVYYGSSWWALTFECARFVLKELTDNKRLRTYFQYAFAPDEMCIQTIIFNSVYRDKALLYEGTEDPGLAELTPLHHIRYTDIIKVFRLEDYDGLYRSDKLFFRKVVTGISDELLDKIDADRQKTLTL